MNEPNQMPNQSSVVSDNQEYELLAGLTMEEAQVILKALYIADTQKSNPVQFDFDKLARMCGYSSGQAAVIMFSHARRKLGWFTPVTKTSNKRKREDDIEEMPYKEVCYSTDNDDSQIGTQLFDPMDSTYYHMEPMI